MVWLTDSLFLYKALVFRSVDEQSDVFSRVWSSEFVSYTELLVM